MWMAAMIYFLMNKINMMTPKVAAIARMPKREMFNFTCIRLESASKKTENKLQFMWH